MDTSFLFAVIDNSDSYHNIAKNCYQKLVKGGWKIITSEAVIVELGNGLSKMKWRQVAHQWITCIKGSKSKFKIIPTTTEILYKAVDLFGSRLDKEWGLTDCISFIVMQENRLTRALTFDHHFAQAGYNISMDYD